MTIINNRRKICSEVPSDKYKDNYDKIFGKKEPANIKTTQTEDIREKLYKQKEDKDGNT